MNNIKLIIFDLDGVLINSLNNMKYALKNTNKKLGLKLEFSKYRKYIGLPFFEILKKIGVKKNFKEIEKNYRFFSKKKINKIKINKSTINELKKLKKEYRLAIFTSKDKNRTLKITKKINYFSHIVSSEELKRGKPHPEGINKILKISKSKKKNVIYVGDSLYDYIAAKKAKVKYLHATWGYDHYLKKNKKITKINKFSDIRKFFNNKKIQ